MKKVTNINLNYCRDAECWLKVEWEVKLAPTPPPCLRILECIKRWTFSLYFLLPGEAKNEGQPRMRFLCFLYYISIFGGWRWDLTGSYPTCPINYLDLKLFKKSHQDVKFEHLIVILGVEVASEAVSNGTRWSNKWIQYPDSLGSLLRSGFDVRPWKYQQLVLTSI